MSAMPSAVIELIWDQFRALIPERTITRPVGSHRRRIPDRFVFDKLVQARILGAGVSPKPPAAAKPQGAPRYGRERNTPCT